MSESMATQLFVVDRIEGRGKAARAILVSDDDEQLEVARALLGKLAVEGAVLRIPFRANEPQWSAAVRDETEEQRRIADATETLKRLSANDPGGDLEL